ncbi:MAG: two-component regulator propeller domain-containing protein, partial [Bacteroidota bacterium]
MHHSHRTSQIFRFIFLFLFLLLSVETVRCQILPFQSYTARDGLPSNTIRVIYQDTRGYLWIGTNNGLSRYDGAKFTNYSTVDGLSNNWITAIAESPKEPGTLWIGTIAGGVNRLRDRRFTVFRPGPDNTSNNIQSIDVDSSGTVWLKAWDRMYYIRGDSLSEVAPPYGMDGVRYSFSFADNTPWLVNGNRLFRYERHTGS